MKSSPDVSLILPCFNEARILKSNVTRIERCLINTRWSFEIIFVDDKSTDTTVSLLKSFCEKRKYTKLLKHDENLGRGKSVVDGIMMARGKVVGYIDIDLEVSASYIPEMVDLVLQGEADLVIGKRVYRTTIASIPREILSRGYSVIVSRLLGTNDIDTESGYKFFNRKKILPIIKNTKNLHWFWDTEVTVLAKRAGLKIIEIPVLYMRRFDKKSTVRVIPDTWNYMKALIWFWRRNK